MKLLIVDDDKVTRELLREIFERENYEVTLMPSGEEAVRVLETQTYPIVLSDIRMLDLSGLELLSRLKRNKSSSVVILMTGFGNMEGAVTAIQLGAFDYISKPFKVDQLKAVVERAAKHWQAMQDPSEKKNEASVPSVPLESRVLIGKSPAIVEVYKTLARATMTNSNVLIIGESGTGKELVARGIHDHSSRRAKPFVAVNCGALAESLLESELFGHVKGAFTGAMANKTGLFEEADQGTIFLDEIGDISPALQVKLLRTLQEHEIKMVGGVETKKIDVRVIAATHRNLDLGVKDGRFREDLYYRLKVILIELPPLRGRTEDLPDLINHFLQRFSEKTGKKVSHISDEAMTLLMRYGWPGNVRELEHAIERAVAMTRTTILYPEDFPSEIRQLNATDPTEVPPDRLEEVERMHILKVLDEANYNKSRAAQILGIDRKTLHRKAERYKISLSKKKELS